MGAATIDYAANNPNFGHDIRIVSMTGGLNASPRHVVTVVIDKMVRCVMDCIE